MASIPIQEDKDLFETVFGEVVEQADLDDAEAQKLLERLESFELDTVTAVAMWDDQSLLGGPAARPAGLARLRQDVMGAGTTPPPVDSNRLRNTIGLLADRLARKWVELQEQARSGGGIEPVNKQNLEKRDSDVEATIARSSYVALERLQGRSIGLNGKVAPAAVARAAREMSNNASVANWPSVLRLPKASRVKAKHETDLGQMADGSAVRLTIAGESATMTAKHTADVIENVRDVCNLMAAVGSIPVGPKAYGGGVSGWIRPPGAQNHTRVMFTIEKTDALAWTLVSMSKNFADFKSYGEACDRYLAELSSRTEECTMHPSDIIDQLATRSDLRYPIRAGVTYATVDPSTDDDASASSKRKGMCPGWISNGGCRLKDDGCPFDHPERARGALKGDGSTRRKGRGGGAWDNWGGTVQWADQNPTGGKGGGGKAATGKGGIKKNKKGGRGKGT